uniref:Uncharacterized protein n=1 Tax=Anguilla anguilla TaxID=7936 RepID=A0A0E9VED4_ANGAN
MAEAFSDEEILLMTRSEASDDHEALTALQTAFVPGHTCEEAAL